MRIFRGLHHLGVFAEAAVTIGNFDGVHRGHQAMIALLKSEARHRSLPACVLTFEPHPREFFAQAKGSPLDAPPRVALLRDKLEELQNCGVDQVVVMRFDQRLASQSPQQFVDEVLLKGLGTRYLLVGDDFRFGTKRAGDYAFLDAAGKAQGFDAARMNAYEVSGLRVSSSAVRDALARSDFAHARELLGRPYMLSGHVTHGKKLGRELGFPTLNLRFAHARAAIAGIFVVQVHGLGGPPLPAVASFGVRPAIEDDNRVLLEVHLLGWQGDAYGKIVRVEFLHKLRDEAKYDGLDALAAAIAQDSADARAYFAQFNTTRRQTTRDRI
jgi:riboflavin kinase / FMN adenylyltransferase